MRSWYIKNGSTYSPQGSQVACTHKTEDLWPTLRSMAKDRAPRTDHYPGTIWGKSDLVFQWDVSPCQHTDTSWASKSAWFFAGTMYQQACLHQVSLTCQSFHFFVALFFIFVLYEICYGSKSIKDVLVWFFECPSCTWCWQDRVWQRDYRDQPAVQPHHAFYEEVGSLKTRPSVILCCCEWSCHCLCGLCCCYLHSCPYPLLVRTSHDKHAFLLFLEGAIDLWASFFLFFFVVVSVCHRWRYRSRLDITL